MKITKKQAEKIEVINSYLSNKNTDDYILLGDNDVTYKSEISKIYTTKFTIKIAGKSWNKRKTDLETICATEITKIFNACKKDEDFNNYINNKTR